MQTLTNKISGETCANHIRTLKEAYVSEEEIACYNCSGENKFCERYIPISQTELRFSYLRLYEGEK